MFHSFIGMTISPGQSSATMSKNFFKCGLTFVLNQADLLENEIFITVNGNSSDVE